MSKSSFQFGLRTFFAAVVLIAIQFACSTYDLLLGYVLSIVFVAAFATFLSKFSFKQPRGFAAASGIFSGVLWSGLSAGAWFTFTIDFASGFLAFSLAGAFGIFISVPTAMIVAVIPDPRTKNHISDVPELDESKPFMEPYTDTQGW